MKIKVYIMHSNKINYKSDLYVPLLKYGFMKNYDLILPLSEMFKTKYINDLINDSDVVICIIDNINFLLKREIKVAQKLNKKMLFFGRTQIKGYNNVIEYKDSNDLCNKINDYLKVLDKRKILLEKENIYCLGNLTK